MEAELLLILVVGEKISGDDELSCDILSSYLSISREISSLSFLSASRDISRYYRSDSISLQS